MTGAVFVFYRDLGGVDNWGLAKKILPDISFTYAYFGYSVSLSNSTAVIGTYALDNVYIYDRNQGGADNWGVVKKIGPGFGNAFNYGYSVSIKDDILAVGVPNDYTVPAKTGSVFLFHRHRGGDKRMGPDRQVFPE